MLHRSTGPNARAGQEAGHRKQPEMIRLNNFCTAVPIYLVPGPTGIWGQ
jgi:hypothetical protein